MVLTFIIQYERMPGGGKPEWGPFMKTMGVCHIWLEVTMDLVTRNGKKWNLVEWKTQPEDQMLPMIL